VKIDIVTIFPEMVEAALVPGVIGRARQAGLLDVVVHNLRDFTTDRHRVVDDVPFGGGPGMVLKPEPMFRAVEAITQGRGHPGAVLLMSPAGRTFTQSDARRLAALSHFVVLCGRYEGIDERVAAHVATEEMSIGDYVLSGGELPALVVVDAVGRLVPGVVGDTQSVAMDSYTRGLLDYPHYTRPAEFRGHRVPDVLVSGHHAEIRAWRRRAALSRTAERRPELLASTELDDEERAFLAEWKSRWSAQEEGGASAPPIERKTEGGVSAAPFQEQLEGGALAPPLDGKKGSE
jgi:tRNA (guanine37-N1)-methyltransferase